MPHEEYFDPTASRPRVTAASSTPERGGAPCGVTTPEWRAPHATAAARAPRGRGTGCGSDTHDDALSGDDCAARTPSWPNALPEGKRRVFSSPAACCGYVGVAHWAGVGEKSGSARHSPPHAKTRPSESNASEC
jgi:hypothetical protein